MQVVDQTIAISGFRGETGRMLKPLTLPAAVLVALAFAVPASAQAPSTDTTPGPVCTGTGENGTPTCTSGDQADQGTDTIGDGQTVTDPADQVDGPTVPDDGDRPPADTPKQGEVHVLAGHATASSGTTAPAATTPAASTSPSAVGSRQSAESAPVKTLPFTGIDAGPLVAMGLALLGSGLLLRRRLLAG
jgi:hypothetical protein